MTLILEAYHVAFWFVSGQTCFNFGVMAFSKWPKIRCFDFQGHLSDGSRTGGSLSFNQLELRKITPFMVLFSLQASMKHRGWIPVLCLFDVWPSLYQLSAAFTDCEHWERQKVHPKVPGQRGDRAAPKTPETPDIRGSTLGDWVNTEVNQCKPPIYQPLWQSFIQKRLSNSGLDLLPCQLVIWSLCMFMCHLPVRHHTNKKRKGRRYNHLSKWLMHYLI